MSFNQDIHMAIDFDEPWVADDKTYLMGELHLQQLDSTPLPQSQQSDPYTVLGETGEEHPPDGSFTFPTDGNPFIDHPMGVFDQNHTPSVSSQPLSMFPGEDPCVFGPHGETMDSLNLFQQVEPLSWFSLSDEALAYSLEWPSAEMETPSMPQYPWMGSLSQQAPEEPYQMVTDDQSLQLLQHPGLPSIANLNYPYLAEAQPSGITQPFFTVGDGVEFEWSLPEATPHIPTLACTTQDTRQTQGLQIMQRSAHRNPGVSSYSNEAWEGIRPIFHDLFITQNCTLPQTSMVLELVHHFTATEHAFNSRKKKYWPECVKNKTATTGTESQSLRPQAKGSSQSRNRSKTIMANYPSPPMYVSRVLGSIPRALPPYLYKAQTMLLLCIDKFVKGFYDSQASVTSPDTQDQSGDYSMMLDEWGWQVLRTRCQAVSTLVRQNKSIPNTKGKESAPLDRPKRGEGLEMVIDNLLHSKVFDKAQAPVRCSSPNQLSSIWGICRILRGLSPQLRSGEHGHALYVENFIHSVQGIPSSADRPNHVGMAALLQVLLEISPVDFQDTMRISFLCTARSLSSRLEPSHPAVLECWVSYARHWDAKCLEKASFLSLYRKGLEETEQKFGHSHDYTVNLLCNYASAAYYFFHDNNLAGELAMELWNRTSDACGNSDEPLCWNVKTQGMAEAAKMLALLRCINHENKHKSSNEMKRIRRKLKLKGRRARKRFRKALKSPPDPQNAKQDVNYLEKSVERLQSGEWDCKFVAAGLLDTLATLTHEFCGGTEGSQEGAAYHHRKKAKELRLEIVGKEKQQDQ